MPKEEVDYYQMGYDSFLIDKTSCYTYPSQPEQQDQWRNIMTAEERGHWQLGRKAAIHDWIRPHAEPFVKELRKLELKYNATIDMGCGCCGGLYINIDDISYDINEEDFMEKTNA